MKTDAFHKSTEKNARETERRRKNALDDSCNSDYTLGARTGHILHHERIHTYSSCHRHYRGPGALDTGTENCLILSRNLPNERKQENE